MFLIEGRDRGLRTNVQFKGSVRTPGDRDPGVRVVLEIDEYHLEIKRDSELIGRYYLADVEVARDIAERFILFLGDDEIEFLADDALQFAYGGVTAMQEGWLAAQKRKRRHRRAAEDAARRKDGSRPLETVSPVERPLHVSDSDTVRNRRRQAGSKAAESLAPERAAVAATPPPVAEAPAALRSETRKERKAVPAPEVSPAPELIAPEPTAPELTPRAASVKREKPVKSTPSEKAPAEKAPAASARPKAPAKQGSGSGRRTKNGQDPVTTLTQVEEVAAIKAVASLDVPVVQPLDERATSAEVVADPPADTSLAARRKKITADAQPKDADDLGRVRVPEPISAAAVKARDERREVDTTAAAPKKGPVENGGDVRFAPDGHHPSETSTGLLAKLRRPPKLREDHVHTFKESGSSVGLVRRVCIECAYVSIGSHD